MDRYQASCGWPCAAGQLYALFCLQPEGGWCARACTCSAMTGHWDLQKEVGRSAR